MASRIELGRRGEAIAADYLTSLGYRVIDRNWRCRDGEIDVIVEGGGQTVFVEVKTRTSTAYGHPFEAITFGKMRRMRRLAAAWCEAQGGHGRRAIRIDAIAVIAPRNGRPTIEHLCGLS
jgi:putative endonuclease